MWMIDERSRCLPSMNTLGWLLALSVTFLGACHPDYYVPMTPPQPPPPPPPLISTLYPPSLPTLQGYLPATYISATSHMAPKC
jgi:hypothetical protein